MRETKTDQRCPSATSIPNSIEQAATKKATDLSPAECALLETIQAVGFGRIEGMRVAKGLPVLSSITVVFQFKLDQPGIEVRIDNTSDFLLKTEFIRLFNILRTPGTGTVRRIEIRHSLPAFIEVVNDGSEAASATTIAGEANDV